MSYSTRKFGLGAALMMSSALVIFFAVLPEPLKNAAGAAAKSLFP